MSTAEEDPTLPEPAARSAAALTPSTWQLEHRDRRAFGPGTRMADKYEILEEIAQGGSAIVYRAHARRLDRRIALKVQRPEARDDEHRARWLREAKLLVRLQHPSIPRVYELGELPDGTLCIAMELLEGHTLRAVLAERGRLTAPEAAMLGGQLLSALAAVHEHGVVHRDVKPSNLVVTRGRRGIHVKLVDFGAAKPTSENERAITKPSEVIGTPGYLSPEQLIAGAVVDARTDLFAAGVVMFEMLSGERPFGRRDVDLLRGTARGAPMEKLPEQLSRPFRELLSRLLAPSPDDRPASALDALAHLLGTPEGEESQRSPSTLPPPQDTVLLVSPSESRRELWARMAASTGAKVVPVATVDAAVLLAEAGDVPVTVVVDRTAPARPSHVDDELETMHALLALPRHRLRRLVQVLRSQRSGPGLRRTGRVVELVMPVTEPDLAEVLKPEGTAGP